MGGWGFSRIFYHVLAILSLFTLYLDDTKWPIRVDVSLDKNSKNVNESMWVFTGHTSMTYLISWHNVSFHGKIRKNNISIYPFYLLLCLNYLDCASIHLKKVF